LTVPPGFIADILTGVGIGQNQFELGILGPLHTRAGRALRHRMGRPFPHVQDPFQALLPAEDIHWQLAPGAAHTQGQGQSFRMDWRVLQAPRHVCPKPSFAGCLPLPALFAYLRHLLPRWLPHHMASPIPRE